MHLGAQSPTPPALASTLAARDPASIPTALAAADAAALTTATVALAASITPVAARSTVRVDLRDLPDLPGRQREDRAAEGARVVPRGDVVAAPPH